MAHSSCKIVSFFSYRGGTGKSTFAANLGIKCAEKSKVLVIDLDFYSPQFQYVFNVNPLSYLNDYYSQILSTAYARNIAQISLDDIIIPSGFTNLDLMLSDSNLSLSDSMILHSENTVNDLFPFMRQMFQELKKRYSIIILDCPAELNYYSLNAIALSDHVVSVLVPTKGNVEGTTKILGIMQEVLSEKILDVFFTMISPTESEKKHEILMKWKQHFLALGARSCIFFPYSRFISYRHQFEDDFFLKPEDANYRLLSSYANEL